DPATEWLRDCDVALDAKGFIRTGPDLSRDDLARSGRRTIPASLETNVPGVFAVGDVRSGSVKRVGGAIGEGAAPGRRPHSSAPLVPGGERPDEPSARSDPARGLIRGTRPSAEFRPPLRAVNPCARH